MATKAVRSRGMTRTDLAIVLGVFAVLGVVSYWGLYRVAVQGFEGVGSVVTPHHATRTIGGAAGRD